MRLLILDNYDSFTWNLVELVRQCQFTDFRIARNDEISLTEINGFDSILISPGPGMPAESGITKSLIQEFAGSKKILGVCLGHQAIAEVFGGKLYQLETVCHGTQSQINFTGETDKLFEDLDSGFAAGLYHSWAVAADSLPDSLVITAKSSAGVVMGLRHKAFDVKGIQFHPESIMTADGKKILNNWLYRQTEII